jgi:hypothetical protein
MKENRSVEIGESLNANGIEHQCGGGYRKYMAKAIAESVSVIGWQSEGGSGEMQRGSESGRRSESVIGTKIWRWRNHQRQPACRKSGGLRRYGRGAGQRAAAWQQAKKPASGSGGISGNGVCGAASWRKHQHRGIIACSVSASHRQCGIEENRQP